MPSTLARRLTVLYTLVRTFVVGVALLALSACSGGSSSSGPTGTYVASEGDESITLEFKGDNAVTVTMQSAEGKETSNGTYSVDGDRVTVTGVSPEGLPLVLVHQGDVLDGGMGMRFVKK